MQEIPLKLYKEENQTKKIPYIQIFIVILGVFMAVLDTSIINVAIPKMESAFNATTAQIQWVMTGYMLVIGVLVPLSGWLTDRFGAKKLFLIALILFTSGSALCGLAWNLNVLIASRIIQASGGGLMMPVALTVIYKTVPLDRRGMIMGLFGIAILAAPAFGPVLSGYLVQNVNWRWIFYINMPVGLITIFLCSFFMREFPYGNNKKLDLLGIFFSTAGFFFLLYGFSEVSTYGWGSLWVIGSVVAGTIFLIALVITELKVENPMIELRVFKNYMFSMTLIISSVVSLAMFVGIFLLPIYLQQVMGYSAIRTGLFMTPAALASAFVMPISGKLFDKIGVRPLTLIGLVAVAFTTYGFSTLSLTSSADHIQTLYIFRSVGMGMVMMPLMTAGMNTMPENLTAQGSAVNNTVRQVTNSLGTAIFTSYFTLRSKIHSTQLSWHINHLEVANLIHALLLKGFAEAEAQKQALIMAYQQIQFQGFVDGMNDTYFVSTLLILLAWILAWFLKENKKKSV